MSFISSFCSSVCLCCYIFNRTFILFPNVYSSKFLVRNVLCWVCTFLQICHHPPISAFYVTNRSDGFIVSGSILAKSKFYGNSLSAILDGVGQLFFLKRGEDYHFTMPYAHCKGQSRAEVIRGHLYHVIYNTGLREV